MALPYFMVYSGDMQKHLGFRRASHPVKGVYFDLLLLANEGSERGVLIFNGMPLTKDEIAGVIGGDHHVSLSALEELLRLGLLVVRKDGAIVSPEIVAQEVDRLQAAERKRNQRDRDTEGFPPEGEKPDKPARKKGHKKVTKKSHLSSSSLASSGSPDANASAGGESGEGVPDEGQDGDEPEDANPKQTKEFYGYFAGRFECVYAQPYDSKKADFIQLAILNRKCNKHSWPLTDDKWHRAVNNYFATPLHKHTMAHLCADFKPYFLSPQDRYGKPVKEIPGQHNGNGQSHHRPDKSEQNQLAADEAEKRIFGNSANFDADAEVIPE